MKFLEGYDFAIIAPSFFLLLISLIVLSSIDTGLFQSQLIFSILGVFAFIIFSSLHIRSLQNLSSLFYFASLLSLISLLIFGVDVRGAKRWIEFFGFRMQFSEPAKPFLILAFASLLSSWKEKIKIINLLFSLLLFLPILFLLLREPDLGSGIIYSITFIGMLFLTGTSLWYFAGGAFLVTIFFPVVWGFLAQYQRSRIITFINPKHDPLGIGYNAIQSAIAVGSGLLFGRGLGRGVQSQLAFLPERHTDFIFATFSEEFGFVGSFVALLLYFLLLFRIFRIAKEADNRFESYSAFGIFFLLLAQTVINIGMNIGLLPITGVTLPLFSYGGSSVISTMIMLGIVHAIGRNKQKREDILEIK